MNKGTITQIISAVVDVAFKDELPAIYNALKVKLENQDVDTSKVDIPLFATADDAVKDIKLDEKTVIKINVEDLKKEEK